METTPGGCYKDASGNGYHDAEGNPVAAPGATRNITQGQPVNWVDAEAKAKFDAQLAEYAEQLKAAETKRMVVEQAKQGQPGATTQSATLLAETERLAKRNRS